MFKSKLDLIFNWAAFSKACLIIYFNEEQTLAYGVASKFQGGGSWGEYHIIGHSDTAFK